MSGDLFYNNVSLLAHFDGADASTTFTDNSPAPLTLTAVSGAKLATAQFKFGGASLVLNGSSDYVTIPQTAALLLGAGDFTVEAWIRQTTGGTQQKICGIWSDTSGFGFSWKMEFTAANLLQFTYSTTGGNSTTILADSGAISTATQYHVAAVRSGTIVYLFVNGVLVKTATGVSATLFATTGKVFEIGRDGAGTTSYFNGYIDDLRVTKGIARYTVPFTPPTDAFPDVVEIALMQVDLTAPTQIVELYTGPFFDLTAPAQTVEMYTGSVFDLAAPSPELFSYFGSVIELTAPSPSLWFTVHDATGENAIDLDAPMGALEMAFGAHFPLMAPSPTLDMVLTGTSLFSADLDAPMGRLEMSGTASGVMSADLTAPMGTVQIYSGAVISITGPMGTIEVEGTAGSVGSIEMTCPLFELVFEISANAHMSFDLIAPRPQQEEGSMLAWMVAPMGQLVMVGSAVVTATYEAYALNLNHKGFKDPVDELTRYTNFPFTHIVRWRNNGVDHYFGAAAGGLYLLEGTTDHAATPTAIPWAFKTGMDDFGTPNKKTIPAAYFRGRMGPAVTVTLYPGEAASTGYNYTTTRGTDAQNYRQKFGLGIKTAYAALGAAGDGELALDEIELPIAQLSRRI